MDFSRWITGGRGRLPCYRVQRRGLRFSDEHGLFSQSGRRWSLHFRPPREWWWLARFGYFWSANNGLFDWSHSERDWTVAPECPYAVLAEHRHGARQHRAIEDQRMARESGER